MTLIDGKALDLGQKGKEVVKCEMIRYLALYELKS